MTNILKAGHSVRIYNRTPSKVVDLISSLPADVAFRIHHASSPRDAIPSKTGIVTSIVSNDNALREIIDGDEGILSGIGSGGIHLCMSTVSPALTKELSDRHLAQGTSYVSCPVFGRPPVAAARKLIAVPAGPEEAVNRILPLLESTAQKIVRAGDNPENSNVLKLCGNFMILATIQVHNSHSIAEGIGLERKRRELPTGFGVRGKTDPDKVSTEMRT